MNQEFADKLIDSYNEIRKDEAYELAKSLGYNFSDSPLKGEGKAWALISWNYEANCPATPVEYWIRSETS